MTRFVVLDPENVFTFSNVGAIEAIDISGFAGTDFISVALADYPGNSIDPAHTFVDFTSNELGDPDVGPTDSIAFSNSTLPLAVGDCELRFPISLLTQIDKTKITGVRFRIAATQQCTFRALAIRAVAATWVYASTDFNTLYDRVVQPVSPTGSLVTTRDVGTTPILDSFDRGDGPLGSAWSTLNNLISVTSNQATTTDYDEAYYLGSIYSGDVETHLTYTTFTSFVGNGIDLFLHVTRGPTGSLNPGGSGYDMYIAPAADGFGLYRFDNGVATQLEALGPDPVVGEQFALRSVGNLVRCWRKPPNGSWTPMSPGVTDNTYRRGSLGFVIDGDGGVVDNFGGGYLTFPAATAPITPVEFPIVFRADDPPGANDPQPIDASVSVAFNTGSMLAASGDNDTGVILSGAANTGVTVSDDPSLRFTTQFTAEAHIQPTNVIGNKVIVAKDRASAGGQRCYSFELQGSELQLRISSNGTALTTLTTTGANIRTTTKQVVGVTYQQNSAGVSLPLLLTSTIATTAKVVFFINGDPFQGFTTPIEPVFAGTDPFTIGFN